MSLSYINFAHAQGKQILTVLHYPHCVAIGKPEWQVRKASHCGSKQQWRSCTAIALCICCSLCSIVHKLVSAEIPRRNHSIIACSCHIHGCCSLHTSCSWRITHSMQANWEVTTTYPPFYNEPHWSHIFSVKVAPGTTFTPWSQHHFVWDRKAWEASAQSFTLWQQATIEITWRDHSRRHCWEQQSTVHQVHKHC